MSRAEILSKLIDIFRQVLSNPSLIIDMDSNSTTVEGWDSITNMLIIDAIELEFGLEIPIDVIFKAQSVKDLVEYLEIVT